MSTAPGYWGTVFIQDVVDLLDSLEPGDYPRAELFDRYGDIAIKRGSYPAGRRAFGYVMSRCPAVNRRVASIGDNPKVPTHWRVTVKCQDDAGAQMSPEAVGCQP